MNYIKEISPTATISFEKIDFSTPPKKAAEMREEIITFFKKRPTGKLEFRFGGYARWSQEFANELFKNGALEKYMTKITVFGMHVFDQSMMQEALELNKA
jgi:hypothetical protein